MGYKRVERCSLIMPLDICNHDINKTYQILSEHAHAIRRAYRLPLSKCQLVYVLYGNGDIFVGDNGLELFISQKEATEALIKLQNNPSDNMASINEMEVLDLLDSELSHFLAIAEYYLGCGSFTIKFPDGVESELVHKVFSITDVVNMSEEELDEIDPPDVKYQEAEYVSEFDYKHGFNKSHNSDILYPLSAYEQKMQQEMEQYSKDLEKQHIARYYARKGIDVDEEQSAKRAFNFIQDEEQFPF